MTKHDPMHGCKEILLFSRYIDSLNVYREISKGFVPKHFTRKLKIRSNFLSSNKIRNILLKKSEHVNELILKGCEFLNSRHLCSIVTHFKNLRVLTIDGCHSLVFIPTNIKKVVEVRIVNLWRIYEPNVYLSSEDVATVIANSYRYIRKHYYCKHTGIKACIRTMKSFNVARNRSLNIYTIDSYLETIHPNFIFNIYSKEIKDDNTENLTVIFNTHNEIRIMNWTMKKIGDRWYLDSPW